MDIIYPQISKNKLLYIPYYFLFMNINVIKGFFYFIRKTKMTVLGKGTQSRMITPNMNVSFAKFGCHNRLCHIVITSGKICLFTVTVVCISSKSYNNNLFIECTNHFSSFQTIHYGHLYIHKYQVRMLCTTYFNSLCTVKSTEYFIILPQDNRQ